MPLPTPKKGAASATGRIKRAANRPSRAELLLSATQALAAEQLPDEHTMTAIEGEASLTQAPLAAAEAPLPKSAVAAAPTASTDVRTPGATATTGSAATSAPGANRVEAGASADAPGPGTEMPMVVSRMRLDTIRRSPFQPKGRPSTAAIGAVERGITAAGSLQALVGPEGATVFARLDSEAARLAELAFDIAENGIKTPLEVRTAEDGSDECLAGHRRLAAATLAGLAEVPVLHRGRMSSAAAAATVLRGNLHRENFTTWQEAVLVTEVQERRRADGHRDTVRTLGTVMGWSHGKVNMLLRIRRALSREFLERIGDGDAGRAEEALARAAYRDLERLASEPDEGKRRIAALRLLGWSASTPGTAGLPRDRAACTHRPKRGGGFVIEVHEPVEALPAGDAALLRELLESQLTRVRARLQSLGQG